MKNKIDIFFNEEKHKYTDSLGNVYISVTTVIGKYKIPFDIDKMARACYKAGLNGNPKYIINGRPMTIKEIKNLWEDLKVKACDKGNKKHNYLEDAIKTANNYKRTGNDEFINDKIYSINTILEDHNFGILDLSYFEEKGVKENYPIIYEVIKYYVDQGYKIYAEIGVFWTDFLISGLIDVLLVRDDKFVILDWKTNIDDMHFKSGYYKKDENGNRTKEWVHTNKFYLPPLNHLEDSHGWDYTLQLSQYAYLTELHGLKCEGLILAHIRDHKYDDLLNFEDKYSNQINTVGKENLIGKECVDMHHIKYAKEYVINMTTDFVRKINKNRKTQLKLNYD